MDRLPALRRPRVLQAGEVKPGGELAVCTGGPWDGWSFYDAELTARARAYEHTGHGQWPEYVRTERWATIPNPKPKGEPLPARVWEHRP